MDLPVAIVTGTNSGLGLVLAVKLAATHRVFAGMRCATSEKSAQLIAAATEAGVVGNLSVSELDTNSDSSVEAAISSAVKEAGRCDILVNNVGFSVFGALEMHSMDTVQEQLNTNVFGAMRCTKAVLPTMRAQKSGKIINVSSVGGVWGQPFNDVYCASKFAIEGMVEAQAPVFREFGVHITNVQPGAIRSKFVENAKKPDPSTIPAEYGPLIAKTMAACQRGGTTSSQSSEEIADVIMDKVVAADSPPVKLQKLQTNAAIDAVFAMQLVDPTGAAGVNAASARFVKDAARPSSLAQAPSRSADVATLHYFPLSQPSRSVKLFLDEAGIDHEVHVVNVMAGEQKSEEFLKINPAGQVPALSKGDFVLTEGGAMLEYLADSNDLLPWVGVDATTRAKVRQWMHWHHSNTRKSTTAILRPALGMGEKNEAAVEAFSASVAALEKHFSAVGPFIAGTNHPTIADLLLLPEIDQLMVTALFDFSPYPKVTAWVAAAKGALPRSYSANIAAVEDLAKKLKAARLTLHYFPLSQPSRSVKLFLDEAGIDHEVHVANIMAGEQKSEAFLKINSAGQVPVLPKGDFTLTEGGATIPVSSSPQPSPSIKTTGSATGNFGDIMSPTCGDADLLFQDGLVTSETCSLEGIYGISNPLDRMAVTANGNLQRLFSAYYDSPVVVEMVYCKRQQKHNQKQSASSIGDGDVDATTTAIWDRRVLLKLFGNQTFCTADSVVEVHSQEVEDLVGSGKVGIGQIFRHFNRLPIFTLLTAGPTDDGGFWRHYTLESDLVTCSIREVFCKSAWELSPGSTSNAGPQ